MEVYIPILFNFFIIFWKLWIHFTQLLLIGILVNSNSFLPAVHLNFGFSQVSKKKIRLIWTNYVDDKMCNRLNPLFQGFELASKIKIEIFCSKPSGKSYQKFSKNLQSKQASKQTKHTNLFYLYIWLYAFVR